MIPVIRGPVEFVVAVAIIDGVLRLVSGGVDECERLTHGRLTPDCRTFPNKCLPGLRSGMERENRQRRLWLTMAKNVRGILDGPKNSEPDRSISVRRPKIREICKISSGCARRSGSAVRLWAPIPGSDSGVRFGRTRAWKPRLFA